VQQLVLAVCLLFSGACALIDQLVWTRWLGLSFGTTTEAIAAVLSVFFGGLALGNWLAARRLARVALPLRVYAALEAAIGGFALLSLPLLRHLDALYELVGVPESGARLTALRIACAALLLLPPTLAMGATLPVVARGLVTRDDALGRTSAFLYGANTLGAVLGAYLCGFWAIPLLGLTRTLVAAACTNLAVAALAALAARGAAPVAPEPDADDDPTPARDRRAFLAFFAVSGFVAIGYEIVWSKVFGIVMEGTLYGFAAVLSAYLLGIAAGSFAIASRVDRLRDPARTFALLHVGIGLAVVLGLAAVPYLPYVYERLAGLGSGADAVHLLYLIVLPIVLLPTALFGAAFPVLIRVYTRRAGAVGRGIGLATAVNTAGSIAASLAVGFWWIPSWGTDATLYALLWLDFGAALAALLACQQARGRERAAALFGSLAVIGCVSLAFGGVRIEDAISGRQLGAPDLAHYAQALKQISAQRALSYEGRASIVTVYAGPAGRTIRTNGMPESSVMLAPPFYPSETVALGVWPYALAAQPRRALVIGLGGGNTVAALQRTQLEAIDVVELERGVARAVELLHHGMPNPLADSRVHLVIDDGRDYLLRRNAKASPGYDLIASQPSHPWRVGAANLFTEEFFRVARASLTEGGVFTAWLNGFRIDADSFLAVVASFERVFPGALLVDLAPGRQGFLLLGAREPIEIDSARFAARLAEPALAELLAGQGIAGPADLLARIEGPARVFAALAPEAANTDDNAFVETRTPRALAWNDLDFRPIEARLAADAPVLPPVRGAVDVGAIARALLRQQGPDGAWLYQRKLEHLLARHGHALDPLQLGLLDLEGRLREPSRAAEAEGGLRAVADAHPESPAAWRLLGEWLARHRSAWREASDAFARAHAASGAARDAYDAGRALHPADPAGARVWFARIPASARSQFPRLAYYDAYAALDRGLRGAALEPYDAALERFVATDAGRSYPGAQELASRVAFARGDPERARRHADADARQRSERARPLLARAASAIDGSRPDEARAALGEAAGLVPGNERLAWLQAELAAKRGNENELARAFAALRESAPSQAAALGVENAFRSEHGLPLAAPPAPGNSAAK
jgi:spermidine synthase